MTRHHNIAFRLPPDGDVHFSTGTGRTAAAAVAAAGEASTAASGGAPFPGRGRREPDDADCGRGSVPVPDHRSFPDRRRPRHSAVPFHRVLQHGYRDETETTQQQKKKHPLLSHKLVALVPHDTLPLSPSRNIPPRLFGAAGRSGINNNRQEILPPSNPEIDPPTLSSLTSVSESDDSERLRKLLRTRHPLFRSRPAVLAGVEVENLASSKGDAFRDQQRLAATAHRSRSVVAPSSYSSSVTASEMIRKRVATGEELFVTPADPTSPAFETERPNSAGGMAGINGFRDFAPRPRNEYVPPKAPDDSARRERERERERLREEAELAEKLRKKELKGRTSKANREFFGRKASTPGKDKHGDGEWASPSPDGRASEEARRPGGVKSTLPRRTSSLSLKSNREGEPLFHGVQKRTDGRSTRSPASTRDARDAIREPRPTSAASAASATSATSASSVERERRRTLTSPGIPKHSRIPASASPSVSRPGSQQDRRTASTISSATERRPLRNPPSSGSSVSRSSESSSQRGGSQHGRSESHPNPSLHVEKRAIPKPSPVGGRGSHASHMRRSESVPSTSFSMPMPGSNGFSRTPSLKTDKSSEGSEKAGDVDVTPSELGDDDDDDDDRPDMDSPSVRKMRGNSIDSFLGLDSKQTTAANTAAILDTLSPIDTNAMPVSNSDDSKLEEPILSPTLSDYGLASSGSSESPLYDRSTGKPKTFPKPKSALEDDDDDLTPLEELQRKDREYQELLNPSKNDDEEDTYQLLGGSRQYEPITNRPVRPKAEAAAGDRKRDREKNAHEQLMNRLKTLHMELRSARRGIDYIERRLNGVGSSDEGEWVDDEDEPSEGIVTRIKAEELRQRQRLRAEQAEAAAAAAAAAVEPEVLRPYEPSTVVKVGTVGCQLALLWFLLEIYFL
ncbi:hypothetical protein BZA05DRAFT_8269 [Tricharina praecox]|uniref:uncharacterized protein n=1 Tax=Tricharina praecox TaxID=43433 RepID=UPI0022210E13|nr:uncharacterized protein BZA05DRAFT_8269 [Tricharina praecox]KAI5858586.1 hypothetical protein BZA05DRAFT_8269 [Tricharina praecox]